MTEKLKTPLPIDLNEFSDGEIDLEGESFEELPETESSLVAARALERLMTKEVVEDQPYPKETIIGDGDHIEGQQLSFIKTKDGVTLTFKLTEAAYDQLADSENILPESGARNIVYEVTDQIGGKKYDMEIARAAVFEIYGLDIEVVRNDRRWRALNSLVNIHLPLKQEDATDQNIDELSRRADAVMRDLFGVEGTFTRPDYQSEISYKEARYLWHHKLENDSPADIPIDNLVRAEVFPGYSTIVEPGKHQDYQRRYGNFALMHEVADKEVLLKILQNGLMASHERLQRGVKIVGMSTEADLNTGGGDNVFTRFITEDSVSVENNPEEFWYSEFMLVIKPSVVDRTDWYAYDYDEFGSTHPETFQKRLSPDQLFKHLKDEGFKKSFRNEQMFRNGIPTDLIAGIAVGTLERKIELLEFLNEAGINEVNGVPIDAFVHIADWTSQIIDIANGQPLRGSEAEKLKLNGEN